MRKVTLVVMKTVENLVNSIGPFSHFLTFGRVLPLHKKERLFGDI